MAATKNNYKKYEECVAPRLDEVAAWAAQGLSKVQIAVNLGIGYSSIARYICRFPEFAAAISAGRNIAVEEIKAAMFRRAVGFEYEETKNVQKTQDGVKTVTQETVTKYALPDTAAAAMLLRQWDAQYVDRDATTTSIRREELQLKQQIANSSYLLEGQDEMGDITHEQQQ